MFCHSGEGVIFTEPKTGEVLAANPAACRLLGHSEEDMRRLGREGFIDPEDRARWEKALAERARRGYVDGELSFRRGDGSTFAADVTSAVFTDATGNVRNCLILRDVTVRQAAVEALRTSEQLLRRLIATSNDAFIAMDTEGCIQEWNQQAE